MSRATLNYKLVFLGDTGVGKSCLVNRFVRGEFLDYQESTIGGASAQPRLTRVVCCVVGGSAGCCRWLAIKGCSPCVHACALRRQRAASVVWRALQPCQLHTRCAVSCALTATFRLPVYIAAQSHVATSAAAQPPL